MKKSIKTNKTIRMMMLSLPAVPVAIAFFMLLATLLPFSGNGMCHTAALVEQSYVYRIYSGSKQVAWFRTTGGGQTIEGLAEPGDSSAVTTVLTEGCWANDMPVVPSCRGRILIPDADEHADSMVAVMNKNTSTWLQKEHDRQRKDIQRLTAISAELDYYLGTHDVQDEGFNSVAEYAGRIKMEKSKAERLAAMLEKAIKEKKTVVRRTTAYTLITATNGQKTRRTACKRTDEEYTHGFIMIQTADRKTPADANAIYINSIMRWHAGNAGEAKAAGICGTVTHGIVPEKCATTISTLRIGSNSTHDMPPLIVPDGAPVFSRHGFFMGISKGGKIVDVRKKEVKKQ